MYTVQYFFLSLVAYCHDMVMVSSLRDRGVVHAVGPVVHSMDEAVGFVCDTRKRERALRLMDYLRARYGHQDTQLVLQDEEDGELRWMNGIQVQINNTHERIMRQFRDVQDILDHDIENLARENPEVKLWLQEQGGINKLNEKLSGKNLTGKHGWYQNTIKYFKRVLGHVPPAFGKPSKEHADSATTYGGYAVNVHRTMVNRKCHGEVADLEGVNDWATTETNISDLPGWYRRITYSQMIVGKHRKAPYKGSKEGKQWLARQIADGLNNRLAKLRPVICYGPSLGDAPYTNVYEKFSDAQVDRNPDIQRLISRFRNEPERMVWKKIEIFGGKVTTWVAGIITGKGNYVWLSLSKQSNELFDYYTNDGKNVIGRKINFMLPPREKRETYHKYNLVKGHRFIRTKKKGDALLVVHEATKDYPDSKGKDYIQVCKIWEEEMTPQQWGAKRKRLIKEGWESVRVRKGTIQADTKEMDI